MPRLVSPRGAAKTDVLGNTDGKFVANRDKVVDKPKPSVFCLAGKKMYTSPLAHGTSPIAHFNTPRTGTSSDVSTPGAGTPGRSAGKRICYQPSTPDAHTAADGVVPRGNEYCRTGSRGHSAPPLSGHSEDSPHGKKTFGAEKTFESSEENNVYIRTTTGTNAFYDKGKKTNLVHPHNDGEIKTPTTECYQKSQRYGKSPMRGVETINAAQPEHRSAMVINSKAKNQPTLQGVMKATPLPKPAKEATPAPWKQQETSETLPPKGRRASPFRAVLEKDGFSTNGTPHKTGLRCTTPTGRDSGMFPLGKTPPSTPVHHPTGRMHQSSPQRTSIVGEYSATGRPSGRRHNTPSRSESPFALHV